MLDNSELQQLASYLTEEAQGLASQLAMEETGELFFIIMEVLTSTYKEGLKQGFDDGKAFQEDLTNSSFEGVDEDGELY